MTQTYKCSDLICGDFVLTYSKHHRYVGIGMVIDDEIVQYNYIVDAHNDHNVTIVRTESHDMLETMMVGGNCMFKLTEDEIRKHIYMEEI